MRLVIFGYKDSSWNLNPIQFQPVNLLVGRNAVGKSKVIKSLSNDSFLMDVVDLEYWNILQRTGSVVEGINHITHPDLFDNFGFTGLSNFDLFSSDYMTRHLTKKGDE